MYSTEERKENCESEVRSSHRGCRIVTVQVGVCGTWVLDLMMEVAIWHIAQKMPRGMIRMTYFRILLRLVVFYVKKNVWIERGWGSIPNYLHMAQSCKILPPPDPDRQLLHSLPLEQLFSPSSWFHLRRSRYTRSMRTSPKLCSQLNQQEICSQE